MRDPGYISEAAWNQERRPYRDADGYDLEQDSRWHEVAGSDFYRDPSLDAWSRPSLLRSPVRREDFSPAGLPKLGAVPASADRGGTPLDAPASSSRRVLPPFAA